MMLRKQDLGVLLFYYFGYSKIRNFILRLQNKPVARFVMFHDIPTEAIECFKSNLRFLKRSANVVSLDDFFSGNLSPKKINVVITFDDGYKSWVTDAVPILKELELPATFFVSSGFVGLSKEKEADFLQSKLLISDNSNAISGLNFEDIRNIAEKGFTIGGHTMNHQNLKKLLDKTQLRYEIAEDKIRLEKIIGKRIQYFAYPFGAFDNPEINLTDVLRECGYLGAVTTVSGFNRKSIRPYLLHREITNASMPGAVFKARTYGNYDAVQFIKQQVNKILQWR